VMEIQYRLIYTLVLTFLTIFAAKTILRMLTRLRTSNTGLDIFNNALNGSLALATIILFALLIGAPYWLMDVRTPLIYGIVWFLFALCMVGRLSSKSVSYAFQRRVSRRTLFRGVIGFLVVALVIQLGAVLFFQFNWNNNYLSYDWYPLTQKQITVTRWAAGLDSIQTASILNLPTSNTSTILGLVRQWDQQAASVTMTKEIGAYNWMSLSSTEIVFPANTEYWVSPTAPSYTSTDWISEHLIYTHASRVMVINTHTGAEVTPQQAFNISYEPSIYYGTTMNASSGSYNATSGFYKDVYVHIPGYREIGNETYNGEPDYTLDGWQKNLWFTFMEGQFGFAFSSYPVEMLWNRDIFNRVQSILIPGLTTDPASYLVSDGKNLYYLVQVYIDYPLQSGFAASPYLRFFGVVLVNIYDGSMQGYTVYNVIGAGSADFLSTFYNKYYSSWPTAPDWLEPQIRYPEQLLGNPSVKGQLDYDFLYHVEDPFVWRSGSQFYERPAGNTVQYIPWAVGNQTYFVGMQLAHFVSATSQNLAGVYIAYGGDRLGQIYLYQNPSLNTTFIGPTAAGAALQTNQIVRTQLTLLPNYRIGSYLLYSVGGRLDYFVAVYTNPGTTGVVTQLPFMTAVDPTTANVATGSSASAAYYSLIGGNQPVPTSNMTKTLLTDISSLISSMNYTLVKATNINPTVFIRTGTFSLSNLGVNQTVAEISDFLKTYGPGSVGNTIYQWSDSSGNLNIGVFKIRGGSITELYYVTVT
jgi:hypothetical protein